MAKVANLSANLTADTASFETNLTRAGQKLNSVGSSMGKSLSGIDGRFGDLGKTVEKFGGELFSVQGALGTFIGAGTLTGLIELTKGALEAVGGLGSLATQIGVSTDTLQAFQYAATQTGLSSDDLQAGLAKLSKTVGDAEQGNKAAIDSFDRLGVKILDAGGNVRSTDDIILDIANGLQKIQDPASRAAAVIDLFGKAGQKLLPFLQNGSDGISQFIAKAKELGLVFDTNLIESADAAVNKIAEMELRFSKLGQSLALLIAGPFNDFADWAERVGKSEDDNTASTAALAQKMDALAQASKDVAAAQAEIATKTAAFNNDKKLGLNLYSQDQYNADIKNLDSFLAQAQQRLATLQGGNAAEPTANHAGHVTLFQQTGVSNPKPTSTGKSPLEQNSDKIKAKIDELNFALDQLGQPDLQQKINTNLKGIDLTMPGAKEGAATIAVLTKEQQNNEIATEGMTAAKEADAQADQEWQQELARGQQVHASVETAAQSYADTLSQLNDLLADGAISQDDYTAALDQANQKLQDSNPLVKSLKDNAAELGQEIGTAFEDAVLSGKSLHDVLVGLLQDVSRLLLRIGEKQVEGAFGDLLGSLLGSISIGGGGTNLAGVPLGHATGGLISGAGGPRSDSIIAALSDGEFVVNAASTSRNLGLLQAINSGQMAHLANGGMAGSSSGSIIPDGEIGNTNNITIAPNFNIQASGGTQDQNKDMADKLSKQIVPQIRQMVQSELATQLRGGGMLNSGYGRA